MNRDQFDAAASAAIRFSFRDVQDLGGQPNARLLDDLWEVAQRHADETASDAVFDCTGERPMEDEARGVRQEPRKASPAPKTRSRRRT